MKVGVALGAGLAVNVDNNQDNRRAYRELLFKTPGLGEFISGAITFEETLFDGIEQWPMAFQSLFTGGNTGKVVIRTA